MYTVLTVTPVPGMTQFISDAPGIFGAIVDGAKEVASLFTVWPVNLFLIVSLLGIASGLILKFKK